MNHGNRLDDFFVTTSKAIIEIISKSDSETLEDFTKTQTLEMFGELTNYLTQSIYNRAIIIDNDYESLTFSWHAKISNLFVLNVSQVNNNIKNYCCVLAI